MTLPHPSPKIIGFCGYPGSGKDEAAKFLTARGWQRVAFADPLRAMALAIDPYVALSTPADDSGQEMKVCAWGDGETFKVRKLGHDPDPDPMNRNMVNTVSMVRLSRLVHHLGWTRAKLHPEVRRLLQRIGTEAVRGIVGENTWVDIAERTIEVGKRVVFTDVRFANEAEMIRRRGGLICKIVRPGRENAAHNQHSSESYPFTMDCVMRNDGTLAELENQVLEIAGISL